MSDAAGAAGLTWDVALRWLDANFAFRVSEAAGAWSYRLAPNGSSVRLNNTVSGVVAELDKPVPGLQQQAQSGSSVKFKYVLSSLADLQRLVKTLRGSVIPPAVTSMPTSSTSVPSVPGVPVLAPSNTILYGPPGTGKTFETARRSVMLCDGQAPQGRAELMARYEVLRAEKRITFVTFHQSYGYEEFVEGLRPKMDPASRQVVYDVVPGAFRRACDSARIPQVVKPGLGGKPLQDRTMWKMGLGAMGTAEGAKVFKYCMENSCVLLGWGDDVDFSDCADADAIRRKLEAERPDIEKKDSQVSYVDAFKNELVVGDVVIVAKGNSQFRAIGEVVGEYEFAEDAPFHQKRAVKWLAVFEAGRPVDEIYAKQFVMPALYKLSHGSLRLETLEKLVSPQGDTTPKPYVFIIDEINRANISKVFGELITLLEPDKREGALNALSVELPYSADNFSIPGNIHLIGTMNTADRSIALLDTALRRRFDFEELTPAPAVLNGQVVEGIDLSLLLRALNERIEVLYDRDHTIGHAFFLGVTTLSDLEAVFRRKVLPLLQEYFYESWSKVRRALNDLGEGDFVRRTKLAALPADGEDDYVDESRIVYSVNKSPFPLAAYKRIYGAL